MRVSQKLIFGGVIAIAMVLAVWTQWHKRTPNLRPSDEHVQPTEQEILKSPTSVGQDVSRALRVLSIQKNPEGMQEALNRIHHEDPLVRGAAAEALGHYEAPQALVGLQALLKDPSERVRAKALLGLGHDPSDERQRVLLDALKSRALTSVEKIAGYTSIVRMGRDPKLTEISVQRLADFSAKGDGPEHRQVAFDLMSLQPRHAKVLALLHGKIETGGDPSLIAPAIRHLAAVDPGWISPLLSRFLTSQERLLRQAALESIPLACPKTRWELIGAFTRSKDAESLSDALIATLRALGGGDSTALMDQMIQSKELSDRLKASLQSVKDEMASTGGGSGPDSCVSKKP